MTTLVEVSKDRSVRTTSRIVAKVFGKEHRNVLQSIENLDCSERFSLLNFQQRDFTNDRGQTFQEYAMTRDGFMFLVMGFTGKKAAEFKELFIDQFNQMEKALLKEQSNHSDQMWLASRQQSKMVRLGETDVIKQFVEYATAQGSASAKFYYKHVTMATYKCLQLIQEEKPAIRDTLDALQLANLMSCEGVAQRSMLKHMAAGEHYKVVFELVKQDIEKFAAGLMLPML